MRVPQLALWLALAIGPAQAGAVAIDEVPGLERFVAQMQERHGFERAQLERWFASVSVRREVVEAMQRPAEALPWHEYRGLFVNDSMIERGVAFARQHAALLERARNEYGVAPEVIVAILGVETRYGRNHGRHRVLDSLTTLAFFYPRRAEFFRGELEALLLLAREEGFDPVALEGSYAGAMGQAQFIASSYRAYAVDFDGDGRRDLAGSTADAVGSIASYLHRHGWRPGGPVVSDVELARGANLALAGGGPKPDITIAELRGNGIAPARADLDDAEPAVFYALPGAAQPHYRLGFHNFYVITRYNRSINYAMAVYELASAIASALGAES